MNLRISEPLIFRKINITFDRHPGNLDFRKRLSDKKYDMCDLHCRFYSNKDSRSYIHPYYGPYNMVYVDHIVKPITYVHNGTTQKKYSVNDLPMNNFSDFRDLMQRLTRTSDDIKMRIENVGFIPEPGTRHGFKNFEPIFMGFS